MIYSKCMSKLRRDHDLFLANLRVRLVKVLPTPMAHMAAPISVSISSRPHICKCSKCYTQRFWRIGSSAYLTFPIHSHTLSARQESSAYQSLVGLSQILNQRPGFEGDALANRYHSGNFMVFIRNNNGPSAHHEL